MPVPGKASDGTFGKEGEAAISLSDEGAFKLGTGDPSSEGTEGDAMVEERSVCDGRDGAAGCGAPLNKSEDGTCFVDSAGVEALFCVLADWPVRTSAEDDFESRCGSGLRGT